MNYAEDRLDRKARYSESTILPSESSQNLIQRDLMDAYSLLNSTTSTTTTVDSTTTTTTTVTSEEKEKTLSRLKKGHELAGRTLRDCGKCHQATFHYGMAWMCNVHDETSAGKYS